MQTDLGDVVDPMATMVEQCRCSRCDDARREVAVCSEFPPVGEDVRPGLFAAQVLGEFRRYVPNDPRKWDRASVHGVEFFLLEDFPSMEPTVQRALIAAFAKVLKG